jgi:CDP-diacylglycerol--serine O-phosphatidyltransferase
LKEIDSNSRTEKLSLFRLLPNIFTTIGMCSGLTGIRYALEGEWKLAVFCIFVAAFFDLIDGVTARVLNASTRFGAELDSLADAISFGVTPSLILFLWLREDALVQSTSYLFGWYWIPFLFYTSCCVLRLARFNVGAKQNNDEAGKLNYFIGVPAPAAAFLALLPIVFQFTLDRFNIAFSISLFPYLICVWIMVISLLMVSRLPTLSLKNLKITVSRSSALILMISTILLVAVFIKEMWLIFSVFSSLYCISIPFGIKYFKSK